MTGRPLSFDATSPAVTGAGRRMRLHAFAVLALTLLAGLALGWGLARRVGSGARDGTVGAAGAPFRGGGPPRPTMKERLALSDAQCRAIDSVFASRRGQIEAFWRGPGGQLRAIFDSTSADVRALLDSTQRVRLDSINAARRERAASRGDGRAEGRGEGRGDGHGNGFCGGRGGDGRGGDGRGGGPPGPGPR